MVWFADEGPLLLGPLLATAFLCTYLRQQIGPGSWLSFLDGRIVSKGLPHTDFLTVLGSGRQWVDQQWLAHWLLYRLLLLGGLRLTLFVHVALFVGALAIALIAARRLGGNTRATLYISLLAILSMESVWQLRAQSLVLPLFAALIYLLVNDCRRPSSGVLLVLPIMVLWANLHGSVALAAGLVALRGLTRLNKRSFVTAALLLSPLAVFVSPYSADLWGYYRHMLTESPLGTLAVEWRPVYDFPLFAAFYLGLVILAIYILLRAKASLFEVLALSLLACAGMLALRNTLWFALAAMIVLPAPASKWIAPFRKGRPTWWQALVLILLPLVCIQAVFTAAHSASWYSASFPSGASQAVARAVASDPDSVVLGDVPYSDWLLYEQPTLYGKVAYDTRIELLTNSEMSKVSTWLSSKPGWMKKLPPRTIFVVGLSSPSAKKRLVYIRRHGVQLFRDKTVEVWQIDKSR